MFEFAALTYGVVASFVVASASRNRREARGHPPLLMLFGWLLMAFSMTMGVGLFGYVGYQVASGGAIVA